MSIINLLITARCEYVMGTGQIPANIYISKMQLRDLNRELAKRDVMVRDSNDQLIQAKLREGDILFECKLHIIEADGPFFHVMEDLEGYDEDGQRKEH